MMKLDDIKKDQHLINVIDWDMTPEEAVRLYLEWGNNWAGGNMLSGPRMIQRIILWSTPGKRHR
jgi:hypothetical protein